MEISASAGAANRSRLAPNSMDTAMGGKKSGAVGQMAKQAVSDARAAGADLPRNAQGVAASQIARGADPATIFAALTTPPDTTGDTGETVPSDTAAPAPSDEDVVNEIPPDATEPTAPPSDDTTATTLAAQVEAAYADAILTAAAAEGEIDIVS